MNTEQARFNMIQQQIRPWDVLDPEVLKLMTLVRREAFVPEQFRELAFADLEIPLTSPARPGQCLLAPKMEARMLQEAGLKNTDRVLEIGTGSGYMAALIAAKAETVHSVEIDPALVEMARANLKRAGAANASVDLGDGALGWPLYAPYDVIFVSGALPSLPPSLLQELRIGGRLVAVVGNAPLMCLQRVTRTTEDAFSTVRVLETVISPLREPVRRSSFVF